MRVLGNLVGVFLSFFYIPAAIAAGVMFALQAQIYRPATYHDLFESHRVYERVPDLMVDMMADDAGSSEGAGLIAGLGLPEDKARQMMSTLYPPETLKQSIEPVIGQVVDFMRGDASDLELDVAALKDAARQNFPAAIAVAQDGLPECSAEDLQSGLHETFRCRPQGELNVQLATRGQAALEEMLAQTPDRQVIPMETGEASFNPEKRREARRIMMLSPLVPLVIYLLIAAVTVRSWSAALLWFGIPTLIAGLGVAAIGLVGSSLFPDFLRKNLFDNSPGQDPVEVFTSEMMIDLAGSVSSGVMIGGGILAGFAVVALLATGAVRKAAAPPESGYY
jgi:hypothetical protein